MARPSARLVLFCMCGVLILRPHDNCLHRSTAAAYAPTSTGRRASVGLFAAQAAAPSTCNAKMAPDDRAIGRAPEFGPFTFHSGTEQQLLEMVKERLAVASAPAATRGAAPPVAEAEVLSAIDDFCWHRHWMMNVGDVKGAILDEAVRQRVAAFSTSVNTNRSFRALELGTYVGYSTVRIARLLPPSAILISADPDRVWQGIASEVVELAGYSGRVELERQTAEQVTDMLRKKGAGLDFVFIDHDKADYLPSLVRLERAGLLNPGCTVVADNVKIFRIDDYLHHVRTSGLYKSQYVESSLEYTPLLDYVSSGPGSSRSIADAMEISVYAPSQRAPKNR
mmetsp:Transcript_130393/g.260126  ORF Transcript_130393/g.260126 Transcript_130393/m.260126 type:complete len:338 (+) Transcript_130393:58-1071(+)|eukprot:CAMPEP_0172678046 /NCGR_PEP_ID=MMETSP1074-20121228/15103_1 /TAXON_ID=2916 /ORGANISM="Ceratium fusus, Strain PA161109" /LENGTH=337 /DNA_ID=CAMNT_0013495991 /DNA_START=50 /DNA_END=1063 /DNA_ORIENTATION=-